MTRLVLLEDFRPWLMAFYTYYQLPTLLYSDNKANQIKIFTFRLDRLVNFFLPWTNFIKAVGKT